MSLIKNELDYIFLVLVLLQAKKVRDHVFVCWEYLFYLFSTILIFDFGIALPL